MAVLEVPYGVLGMEPGLAVYKASALPTVLYCSGPEGSIFTGFHENQVEGARTQRDEWGPGPRRLGVSGLKESSNEGIGCHGK